MRSALPKLKRAAPRRLCNDLRSIPVCAWAIIKNNRPLASLRNKFLVWPPAMSRSNASLSATVKTAGCSIVWTRISSSANRLNNSWRVAGGLAASIVMVGQGFRSKRVSKGVKTGRRPTLSAYRYGRAQTLLQSFGTCVIRRGSHRSLGAWPRIADVAQG
ncbi:protein of unknown function [Candidatus Filomicrobium marinum]|nr:protein of unknown function [Candidatus Filomicrobium marinum]